MSDKDPRSQLASHLGRQGLDDAEFWMPKFGTLGVQSLDSLHHLEGDNEHFSLLEGMARNIVEKRALKKLLKIEQKTEESKVSISKCESNGEERIRQLADKLMKELGKAKEDGHDTGDKVEIFDIKSLDEVISKLNSHLQISGTLQKREWLSDSMLLQKVSGGRALQGVYLTKNLEDQLEMRDRLLEIPQNVAFTGASQGSDIVKQFSSIHQEKKYKKTIQVLGHSAAVTTLYGDVTFLKYDEKDEHLLNFNENEVYTSTLEFSTVNVASYSFKNSELKLSNAAKNYLEEILRMLRADSPDVQEACKRFFRMYGSHANRGPLNFGGSIRWKCFSKGFEDSEIDIVKKMQSNAVSARTTAEISFAGFGVSSEVNMETIKAEYSRTCSRKTLANTHLVVTIEGGSPEAADLSIWKNDLVANNSTWILTDRGQKFEAVWDIIKRNHLRNLGDITDVLRTTWEEVTGLTAECDGFTDFEPESIMEEVSQWNEEILTPHQIETNLDHLFKVREDIMSKVSDPFVWINEYILNPVIQKFFESIVDAEEEPSEHLKFLMQRLLVKEELSQVSTKHPCIIKISDWLYKSIKIPIGKRPNITDLESFEEFMKNILDNSKIALSVSKAMNDSQIKQAISDLQSFYEGKYESVLISILISPYQCNNDTGLRPFTLKDLECLHKSFSENRIKFDQYMVKKNPLHLQVYLLQLLVHMKIFPETQLKTFLKKVKIMLNSFYPPLDENLLTEINKVLSNFSSLQSFKEQLNLLMTTNYQCHPPDLSKAQSLQQVLKTKSYTQESKNPQGNQSSVFGKNKEAYDLFKKLDLCEHYPMRLQLKDALCVRSGPLELSLNETHPTSLQDLPHLVLHKLMTYDHLCRSDLMHPKPRDSEDKKDSACTGLDSEIIHPVDSLLALLICSNNYLRQDLLSRLAKCLLAVPFILPDPFTKQLSISLWAMRSIIKDWKCIDSEDKVVEKTSTMTNYKMPIISFIRFGKHHKRGISKSKLLNDVISESNHNHFFHRDLAGGHSEVLLGKGLVDMCWYLSSGKKNETFHDAITFLNLHGDAREYPQQSKFLSKISFMCFILLTEKKDLEFSGETIKILKEFSSSPGGITILNDTEKLPAKQITKVPKVSIIKLTDKNASEIKTSVQNKIRKGLQAIDRNDMITLEDHCNWSSTAVRNCKVIINEGFGSLDQATDIQNMVVSYKPAKESSTKEELLPLQGDLWQTWAIKNKEFYRQVYRGSKPVNIYTDVIKEEKQMLRQGQLKYVKSLTPVMEAFITTLLKLGGPSNVGERNYFLRCLKLGLNEFSRDQISTLQQQYQSIRIQLSKIQEKTDIHEGGTAATEDQISVMNEYKAQMKYIQRKITQASFGLEHIIRELGQIYEASKSIASSIPGLSRLPEAAAELLIDGYPLELMVGNAAHVPLVWLTSVISVLVTKLKDPKVFVLSVLGLQSTGKSTMLNTAFGLQFNVSSGRCTRGAFMQLLPLDEQLRIQTGFSFVLIVDTEGLRAPELDSDQTHKNDNELATFVIGLANTTLINIYGEVPGDMDDILQTSVHAFLRMTKVMKYRKSCQFVHQNAVSGQNTEVGRANFTHKLDKFTADAAKESKAFEGQYVTFNDVIKFNDLKDVHHFPGLLEGSPPMAPINPGYSEAAQKLKYHLIKILKESKTEDYHLSSFKEKVSDLWEALLKENFIFSFKNTLEISAYNSLEAQYSQWEWEFREAMLEWERTRENEITTAELNIVSELVNEKYEELNEHVSILYEKYKSEMDKFFNDSKQIKILVQWRARFETRLTGLSGEFKTHAITHLNMLVMDRAVEKKQNKYIEHTTRNVVQELIQDLRQKQDRLHASIRNKTLELSELSTILSFGLFTPDYLEKFRVKAIITIAEEEHLLKIIGQDSGMTEQCLEGIIVREILTAEQIIKILNLYEQEHLIASEFDSYWNVMLKKIPYEPREPVNVEAVVKNMLIEYVKSYDSQLVDELCKLSLKERGTSLKLAVKEKEHYIIIEKSNNDQLATETITGDEQAAKTITDPLDHQKEAQTLTDEVFRKAQSHIESIAARKDDFNSVFILKLLRKMDNEIDELSSGYEQYFILTKKYKLDVYLSACTYAVVEFEKMAESFRIMNDPQREIKAPLFLSFKNQYYQKKAEEDIVNNLCAHFDESIRKQVRNSLSRIVVGKMKNSEIHPFFKSKIALKVKILTDLYHKNHFDSYMVYVTNVKEYLEEQLEHYTIEFCDNLELTKEFPDEIEPDLENTRLQNMAKKEVSRLVQVAVTELEADKKIFSDWLKAFCKNIKIRRELGINFLISDIINGYDYETIQELNLEDVKCQIRERIAKSKENLHAQFGEIKYKNEMKNWKVKPNVFLKELIGCTEQCPFCHEQCDLQDAKHTINHRTAVHRSSCLAGYKDHRTKIMDADFCPAKVVCNFKFKNDATNREWVDYSKYQKIYPKWTIPQDATSGDSLFWMSFIGRYKDQIAERFHGKPPIVPESWSKIKWDEVEANLKQLYSF